jgi:hypothetical protein
MRGCSPIEMIWVVLKPVVSLPSAAAAGPKYHYLNYPNIPGEDLLENDLVIVQRFIVNPGQWEGGQWAVRSKHEPEHLYPAPSPDGKVGWEPTIDIGEGHESGNAQEIILDAQPMYDI